MNRNLVITGFMGTGKSSVASGLSKVLGYQLYDTDDIIAKMEGRSIIEIFESDGEDYFRNIENMTVKNLNNCTNSVISTGGGTIINSDNRNLLKKIGIIFCLTAEPEVIYDRLSKLSDRPLLNNKMSIEYIGKMLNRRKMYYDDCHYRVDTSTKTTDQVVGEIFNIFHSKIKSIGRHK